MTRFSLLASALIAGATLTSSAAMAEDWRAERAHFIVSLDEKLTSDDKALRNTLQILKVDCFGHDGQYHYVISAKSEGHVGSYLQSSNLAGAEVRALPIKWTSDQLASFDDVQRLALAAPVSVF
ncbi:MAG: hypothetical protein AAFU80_22135 [Pseudomonadota bacterium]